MHFLVPGSSGVEDALGECDTNPPASPVLRCLLYLVPSDPYLLEILVDDSPSFFLTWASRPSPETIWFPMMSSSWDPVTFHAWKMSETPQSSASNNVFQLGECSCLSGFLICHLILPWNAQDASLPSMVCCFKFLYLGDWDATIPHCTATGRELVLQHWLLPFDLHKLDNISPDFTSFASSAMSKAVHLAVLRF